MPYNRKKSYDTFGLYIYFESHIYVFVIPLILKYEIQYVVETISRKLYFSVSHSGLNY